MPLLPSLSLVEHLSCRVNTAGKFAVVAPYDAARFARAGVDIVSTARLLKSTYGIPVVDARGGFDNRSHRNTLRNFVEAGVAEDERLPACPSAEAGSRWASSRGAGSSPTPGGRSPGSSFGPHFGVTVRPGGG
jgi:hypothetical protein